MININAYIKYLPWVLLILVFLYLAKCQEPSTKVITITDTVTVERVDTLLVEKEKPIYLTKWIDDPTVIYVDSSGIKQYSDTTVISDNFFFWYNADVNGSLESMNISYFDNRPDRVLLKTIDNTVTVTERISPKKVMVGATINTLGEITPSALLIRKNWTFSGGYNLQSKAFYGGVFLGF